MKDFSNMEDWKLGADKNLPFSVPEEYFNTLPSRIQSFCNQRQEAKLKVRMLQIVKAQLALAAGFALLAVIGYTAYYFIGTTATPSSELSSYDYIEIVSKHVSNFDNGRPAKELRQLDTIRQQRDEHMIRYLLEEKTDYVTLMEPVQH